MSRGLSMLRAAALTVAVLAVSGCGSKYKLPTEQTANRTAPADKGYQVIHVWRLDDVKAAYGLATDTKATDVLLIPGPQLYFAFDGNPGHVYEFSTTLPQPLATNRFAGLLHPAALAANAASVFVLDQGDTAAARATFASTLYQLDCGPIPGQTATHDSVYFDKQGIRHVIVVTDSANIHRPIVALAKYWYVREFDIKGRTQKGAFTDTTFAWVNGIAADADGRVYVSGIIRHCFVDPFDQRLRTLDTEYRIRRYEPGTGDRYVVGGWRRDPSFEIIEGSGIGSTHDPRGLSWSAATGAALFFADFGNNEVQKFDVFGSLGNSFKLDICDSDTLALLQPPDVAVDDEGNVYVVDTGNRRVLRYDPDGRHCAQRVDFDPNSPNVVLSHPVAAASLDFDGTNYVYVVDAAVNTVVVYRRRT